MVVASCRTVLAFPQEKIEAVIFYLFYLSCKVSSASQAWGDFFIVAESKEKIGGLNKPEIRKF